MQAGAAGNLLDTQSPDGWNRDAMPFADAIVYRDDDSLIVLERTIGLWLRSKCSLVMM
jgi:hypothetical protein